MTISKLEFEALQAPQKIIDGSGVTWIVTHNRPNQGGDVPGDREIWLKRAGTSQTRPYGWLTGHEIDGIVDEEISWDINLNHPNARIVT